MKEQEIITVKELKDFLLEENFKDTDKIYVDFRGNKPVYDIGKQTTMSPGKPVEIKLIFDIRKLV